jgi:predicted RNase H-like nuclease (RuvC/YqgF family)
MTKKKPTPEKDMTGQPSMINKSVLSSCSTAVNTPAEREVAGLAGGQTSDFCRETIGLREDATNLRKGTDDLREEIADLCQETAGLSHEAAELRKKVQRAKKKIISGKTVHNIHTEAQLREANERLVVATVRAQTMTEAAEKATEQMTYMAGHDFLTGLPNRSLLTDRLEHSIALAQRHGKKVALLYLDLDNFKHINDSLGHAVGDQLSGVHSRHECTCGSTAIRRAGASSRP